MNTAVQTVSMVRRCRRRYSEEFQGRCCFCICSAVDVDRRRSTLSRPERQPTVSVRNAHGENGSRFGPVPLATALAEPVNRFELCSGSGTVMAAVGSVRILGRIERVAPARMP